MYTSVPTSYSKTDFEGFQSGISAASIHLSRVCSWVNVVQQFSSLLEFVLEH